MKPTAREHLQREGYRRELRISRQRTFILSWDGAPDCRWAFDAPEGAVQNLTDLRRDIPCDAAWERPEWRSGERGAWTLETACGDPPATLAATLSPATDRIDYAITLTISEPGVWRGLDLHLCFNHCWKPGFGRTALALAGDRLCALSELPNERGIWLRYALRGSTARVNALKRRQIGVRGPGSSLFPYDGIPPWSMQEKMPIDSVQSAFIATERARACADEPAMSVVIGWKRWAATAVASSASVSTTGGASASSGPIKARRISRLPTIIEERQESKMASIEPIHPGEHLAEILHELGVSEALGMTPESWLNLQALYDLDVARSAICRRHRTAGVGGLRMRGVMIGSLSG